MSVIVKILESFSSTYYSDNNSDILQQYIFLKSSLEKHPELQYFILTNPEYLLYDEEYRAIQDQTSFLLRSNWSDVIKKPDVSIQTSRSENEFLIKVRLKVNASPLQVFSVLYETDFASDWMKTTKSSKTLRNLSKFRKVIQNFYKLPWPLVNRHSILNVRYLLMPELHSILVIGYSPEEHLITPVNFDKYIEMVLPSGSMWLKCMDDESELTVIIQANKYINAIPSWIVNLMINSSFKDIANEFQSIFSEFSKTKYDEAMKADVHGVYSEVSKQMGLKPN